MKFHIAAAALLAGGLFAVPAQSAPKPTIAIMPAQYYSADAASARKVTEGLRAVYERQGYEVLSPERSANAFRNMHLTRAKHYPDYVATRFGRRMKADLVAYPRLLAVGLPLTDTHPDRIRPEAVLHLRVLNTHTGRAIYFRQVAQPFGPDGERLTGDFTLPKNVAGRTAAKAASMYFQRVAGSRQEMRGNR